MCFSKVPNSLFILRPVNFETRLQRIAKEISNVQYFDVVAAMQQQLDSIKRLDDPLSLIQQATRAPTPDSIQAAYEATLRYAEILYNIFGLWDQANAIIIDLVSYISVRGDFTFGLNYEENHKKISASTAHVGLIYCILEQIMKTQAVLFQYKISNHISNYKRFRTQLKNRKLTDDDVYKLFNHEQRYNYLYNQFGATQMLTYAYKTAFRNDYNDFRVYCILTVGQVIFEKSQQLGVIMMGAAHILFYDEKDAGLVSGRRKGLVGCYLLAIGQQCPFVQLEPAAHDILVGVIQNYSQGQMGIAAHADCDKALGKLFK